MPSDATQSGDLSSILSTLAPAAAAWRASVVATAEELRGLLGGPATPASTGHALGEFGAGRIDLERFTGIVSRTRPIEDATLLRLRVAFDTMQALAERPPERMFVAVVPSGERLRDAVDGALEEIGRAFGAAHEATFARQGTFRDEVHGSMHLGYPFRLWTRRERRLAPPLLLVVDGADLHAQDLVEFLDGSVKLALVVRGPCPPAALVRLVTPATFVMQTSDVAQFARLASAAGPGVAALMPDGAASFVHDPAAGTALWDRTRVERTPAEPPRRAVGGWSPEQQTEELRQLAALATRPSSVAMATAAKSLPAAEAAATNADPAGRLAAWLLGASLLEPAGAQAHHG